ncbi:maleylpyruvate isomerase family mycothiol-dependent enzyme [Spiractinospora alimapuensis]|uniref:maleylpyruvate isomerase family mycothiol-dependent enzyme n=1 Tax=Spiractinospora alimapuensis TaxID=2820884 RepID=UPI001F3001D5|nr:maleylpyruvate isomerase family mycothiol-dependent enzyme [Spiractinospora alimapuensis]QVQ52995.1 maleylpyruvate isomerase family mycothiol-dependent enzyme [Spiractinospora alimapuensis]
MDNVTPVPESSPRVVVTLVASAHARVLDLLAHTDEATLRAPSGLPGWTRAHVVSHLANNAWALERQVRFARAGERVDIYDGGQEGRDREIEEGATRPRDELLARLRDAQSELETQWSDLSDGDWDLGVAYRDGTVTDTVFARWREAEIHAVDLALTYRPRDWTAEFAHHLLDFLELRVPRGTRLDLIATDTDETRTLGSGDPVTIRGDLRDLTAWIAGRTPDGVLAPDVSALPTLAPWPGRTAPR